MLQLRPRHFCMVLATEKTYTLHINYCKLNLIGRHGADKEAQTDFHRPRSRSSVCVHHTGHDTGHDTFTRKYLPQVSAYSRDACLYSSKYSWCVVNIFTCILLLVHSSCTRQKITSLFEVSREKTSVIVNLDMSCTVSVASYSYLFQLY